MVVTLAAWALGQAFPAVTWVEEANHKWRPLDIPTGTRPGFTLLASGQTGIQFSNQLDAEKSLQNQVYLNGSGVALGDINGDGRPDFQVTSAYSLVNGVRSGRALIVSPGRVAP